MEFSREKPVLVTGATSLVGSHVIAALLARNFVVRGTEPEFDSDIQEALMSLPHSENLALHRLDLKEPQSFHPALSGCSALIHTATPVLLTLDGSLPFNTEDEAIQKQLKPAVQGTEELFTAAANAGVKRIVLTSSTASMRAQGTSPTILDESCWGDEKFFKDTLMTHPYGAYRLAKLLQEKIAWKVAEATSLKLVSIHPGLILGPSLLPAVNGSVAMLLELLEGRGCGEARCKPGNIPNNYCYLIDVREVAEAHVLALEREQVEGRILALSQSPLYIEMYNKLRENIAFKQYPERPLEGIAPRSKLSYNNRKLRMLGVREIPWEDTLKESAYSLSLFGNVVRGIDQLND
ncbi:Cinnamoyl-CoA reductase 1 [Gracilariopsis chorda]|uniref:Cinnamoyl-CoA reductase 1 n=1 Tax=Gracilariopsis chorda TaxID=448386 RepID=A0A2V3IE94_9FLOR|nr:Cinnamoyl-CoA reductase 1 [Gracilariopsis chorda]|eukprot:PXF40406.1 Cinnamoyl-CoA reductase 1 [Gracilariopsis chorda]